MTDHTCLEYLTPVIDLAPAAAMAAGVEPVCVDPGLLRAEFDAIIAANFPGGDGQRQRRPPLRSGHLLIDRPRPRRSVGPAAGIGRSDRAQVSTGELRDRARERSPPEDRRSLPVDQTARQAPHTLLVCGA